MRHSHRQPLLPAGVTGSKAAQPLQGDPKQEQEQGLLWESPCRETPELSLQQAEVCVCVCIFRFSFFSSLAKAWTHKPELSQLTASVTPTLPHFCPTAPENSCGSLELLTHPCTLKPGSGSPGDGGWILVWDFLESAAAKMSGGGSSPRSILHSKAYRHWMYCFFRELAALLDVPTFRLVASSRHFLFLLTCTTKQEALNSKSLLRRRHRPFPARTRDAVRAEQPQNCSTPFSPTENFSDLQGQIANPISHEVS